MGTILVPDVRGQPRNVAKKILHLAGLDHTREVFTESRQPVNIVVDQDPVPNEIANEDTLIQLRVSQKSLVRHLPAIFQPRTQGDSGFITRYLWIFQHFIDGLQTRIDDIHTMFRPSSVSSEFLPWLASWFAVSFRPDMDEAKRRKVLMRAVRLFAMRGTSWEIREMVKLHTDLDIEILEKPWPYRGIRTGDTRIGVDTMVLPQMPDAYCFIVRVPVGYDDIELSTLLVLYEVLNSEKPAHTNYLIEFHGETGVREPDMGDAFMRIGVQSIGGMEENGVKDE